ncbi:MAG: O-antigen ligase family protein [Clostridia bacterium]|nr:O-antigen ligase family protein [Clostridia bacterium]
MGVIILAKKEMRQAAFSYKGRLVFSVFTLYTVFIATIYGNFIGVGCSILFFLIITISYYARSVLRLKIFENGLDICCVMSIIIAPCAIIDKLFNLGSSGYRCTLWFFNTNYLATIMATVIIICAYKVVSYNSHVLFYYITAFCCAVTMYLCGSMFAFVEILVGLFILLFLNRKHFLLGVFLFVVCFCLVILYCVPEIFPRLSESNITTENRITIWNTSMGLIQKSPFFGHGFLSYYFLLKSIPDAYPSTHAHNFALEPILSFGVIGTVMLLIFLWSYFKKVIECKELLRNNKITLLILSVSTAIIVHATTDMTMLWVQTGLLYALVFAGIGIDERALNKRVLACVKRSEKFNLTNSKEE